MKSIVLSVLKDKYLKKKQNGLEYDEERFRSMYGDFVPSKKDLSYVLNSKRFSELVINNIHEIHKEGNGILFCGDDSKRLRDIVKYFQMELCYWGYSQFRTTLNGISELKYGSGRKQEDSREQKQWERVNYNEFLIIDVWEEDFEDIKKSRQIERLIRERLNRELATVVIVNMHLEDIIGVASDSFFSLLLKEDLFIVLNCVKEKSNNE